VWQHLAAGEFIGGTYSGISGRVACAPNSQIGVNSPEGSLAGTAFSITSYGEFIDNSHPDFFDGDYKNTMIFGLQLANSYSWGPALTTEAAMEIDLKADDGSPVTGNIRSVKPRLLPLPPSPAPDCVTAGGVYNEIFSDKACALLFMSSFATRE